MRLTAHAGLIAILVLLLSACDDSGGKGSTQIVDPSGVCGKALCTALDTACGLTTDSCGNEVDCGDCQYESHALGDTEIGQVDIAWESAGVTIAAMAGEGRVEVYVERDGAWTKEALYPGEWTVRAYDEHLSLSLGSSGRAVAWTEDGEAKVARSAAPGEEWSIDVLPLESSSKAVDIAIDHGADGTLYAAVADGGYGDTQSIQLYSLSAGASEWTATEVISGPAANYGNTFNSISLLASNGIQLVFQRTGGEAGGIYLAEGQPGAELSISAIRAGYGTSQFAYVSAARTASGVLSVSFVDETGAVAVATRRDGVWQVNAVEHQYGSEPSDHAIASDGTAHVAFFADEYLKLGSGRGSAFLMQLLNGRCNTGYGTVAVAVDDQDDVHVVYGCGSAHYLKRVGPYPDDISDVCDNITETLCNRAHDCLSGGQSDVCWVSGDSTECINDPYCPMGVGATVCGNPTVPASAYYACEAALEAAVCVERDGEGAVLLPPACAALEEVGGQLGAGLTQRQKPARDCASNPDSDGDGHDSTLCGGDDCNDSDLAIAPGATELCDAIDNDCSGYFEGPNEDSDQDRFASVDCGGDDCSDYDRYIHPGAPEICDGRDSNCDGVSELDADGDGVVGASADCEWVGNVEVDCDDNNPNRSPRLEEVCDGLDNNCSGEVDEGDLDWECGSGLVCQAGTGCEESAFEHLSVGGVFICASRINGSVSCWGTMPNRSSDSDPSELFRAEGGIRSLSLGPASGCLVDANGTTSCFGANDRGQLGISGTAYYSPEQVESLGAMAGVTVGGSHACAWDAAGKAYCWGANDQGQLGVEGVGDHFVATEVPGLTNVSAMAAGTSHTCAVRSNDGAVLCWGSNDGGQRGDGAADPTSTTTPTVVPGLPPVVELAASNNGMLARTASGEVWEWGEIDKYAYRTPTQRTDLSGAIGLAGGEYHACVALGSGKLVCWGEDNTDQLGLFNGETTPSLTAATAVGAGLDTSCAIATHVDDGRRGVWCWGDIGDGQGGDGAGTSATRTATPVLAATE